MDKNLSAAGFPGIDKILELIGKAEAEKERVIIAIDGKSGSGKSFLAGLLKGLYGCNLIHMDYFFLRPHQRTPARLKEPGGNIDYERFHKEVVNNLINNKAFSYQVYDCSQAALTERINVEPKKINIIEGVYSMHPLWINIYDIKIFLTLDPGRQLERIRKRSGEGLLRRFVQEWIPMENLYFKHFNIPQASDLVIDTSSLKSVP